MRKIFLACALSIAAVFTCSAECARTPSALWAKHPTSSAVRVAPHCWQEASAVKLPQHHKKVTHLKRKKDTKQAIPVIHKIPEFSVISTSGTITPIFNDHDNLSEVLHRCADEWGKRHTNGAP